MHSKGVEAGIYGGGNSYPADWESLPNIPDAVWISQFLQDGTSYDPNQTVWNLEFIDNNHWANDQRIHQYTNGHVETWGGSNFGCNSPTCGIDSDVLDGPVATLGYSVGQGSADPQNYIDAWNTGTFGQPTDVVKLYPGSSSVTWQPLGWIPNVGSAAIFHDESVGPTLPAIRAYVIYGSLLDSYKAMGGPNSSLGVPTSYQFFNSSGLSKVNFANGYMIWNGTTAQTYSWPSYDNIGWLAQYYNNPNSYSGPSYVQNEHNGLNFSYVWGGNAPFPQNGMNIPQWWSVIWQRAYTFAPANYTFTICSDDGTRLWLNGSLVIDQYHPNNGACYSYTTTYTTSTSVPIKIQYYQGDGGSAFSFNVTSTPLTPAVPTNLSAAAASYSQINLSWTNAANNADGVYLERKAGANGTYARLATLAANATSYQDTNLNPATTYYYRVQAYNSAGPSSYSNEAYATTNPLYTYYLPYVANNAAGVGGSYTTYVTTQNTGASAANFTINYYDSNGNALSTESGNGAALAPNTKYVATGVANGQSGTATIVSTQPLAIVVSESGTFNGQTVTTSYPAINSTTGVGTTIYAPIALNHSYGNFSTGLVIRNTGTSDTVATIQYYNDFGNPASSQSVTIKAQNAVQVLQSDVAANLPSNFSGWAVITSNNGQPLAGIDVETNPDTNFMSTVACTATPGKTNFIPVVFQNAFGNFVTGMQLVNPNNTAANVTVTYYRKDGTVMQTSLDHASFQIPAHADKSFFHSAQVFPELVTSNGGFVGTAIVTSDQPLLSIVNQIGSAGSVSFNGSFGTVLGGATQVDMPTVLRDAYAFSSGLQIENASGVASTATISYYDKNGNKVYQATLTADDGGPIKPGGSINPYQGSDTNLPDGFDGTAVITANTSGASFIVVGNISNAKIFYTYAEPS